MISFAIIDLFPKCLNMFRNHGFFEDLNFLKNIIDPCKLWQSLIFNAAAAEFSYNRHKNLEVFI